MNKQAEETRDGNSPVGEKSVVVETPEGTRESAAEEDSEKNAAVTGPPTGILDGFRPAVCNGPPLPQFVLCHACRDNFLSHPCPTLHTGNTADSPASDREAERGTRSRRHIDSLGVGEGRRIVVASRDFVCPKS